MRIHRIGLLLALFVTLGRPAGSCPLNLVGSNFGLTTAQTTQRLAPAASYNAVDQQYMVVWFDTRDAGDNDVFGQRVSAGGGLVGGNFPVIQFSEAQIDPWIAHDPTNDEYLVAWRTQQAGFFNKGRGRLLAADGSFIGNDFLIGNGNEISIAYNGTNNEFMVTGRSPDIRGRRVSSSGGLVGPEIVITTVGAPAPNGQVAYDGGNNRYLATWRDQESMDLRGQLIAGDGTLVGGPILISTSFPASSRAASVAFDPHNARYLVVFGLFQDTSILAQFVSASGALVGSNFTIVSGLSAPTSPYVVFSDPAGGYVVSWQDGARVIAQGLAADGTLDGPAITVTPAFAAGEPRMAANPGTGEALIVWPDNRNLQLGRQDIYAQIVHCGNPAGVEAGEGSGATAAAGAIEIAPNPAVDRATISFRLAPDAAALLEIHAADGRIVRTLGAAASGASERTVVWDARDGAGRAVPGGVYFCVLRAGGAGVLGGKLMVVR